MNILTIGQIAKTFRTRRLPTGDCLRLSNQTIKHMANKLRYPLIHAGGKIGYYDSILMAIMQHIREAVEYEKALQSRKAHKAPKVVKTRSSSVDNNYYMRNGERDNVDYSWEKNESRVRRAIIESIEELDLYHGTPHEFDEFDLAYLSSGFGQQSHGYGVYLTTSTATARAYSQGKNIYTVEVPDGKYLNYDKIGKSEAMTIARKFFKYYMTEHEYGREAYKGHENDFWEYECKYLGECYDGGCIYGTLGSLLGSDKDASEFLYRIGYKGLYLKCVNTETKEKFRNYVIFNPKDIKIIRKEKV